MPREGHCVATALSPSEARVQHSPLPTEVPCLLSHQFARASPYLSSVSGSV